MHHASHFGAKSAHRGSSATQKTCKQNSSVLVWYDRHRT